MPARPATSDTGKRDFGLSGWRWWRRLRFAFALTDLDLENINYLCDKQLEVGINTRSFTDQLHRLHDMAVDAS